jgi:hypothetical protein
VADHENEQDIGCGQRLVIERKRIEEKKWKEIKS